MTPTGPTERLQGYLVAGTEDPIRRAIDGRPIALGWSTVELERAAAELGAAFDVPAGRFLTARATAVLGARCQVAHGLLQGGISLVLLEPATEGRLAASLARFDEGPVATWLAVPDLRAAVAALRAMGLQVSAAGDGPFGAERLVLDGPIHGPYRLLVQPAGTIRA